MAKRKRSGNADRQRRGLLAKVHIALKDLAIEDDTYRDLLEAEFGVRSARDLTIGQLERLMGIFRAWGFPPDRDGQILAFRARAREMAEKLPDGEERLKALVKKICGVERLDWARDVESLKRLAAALGKISREYYDYPPTETPRRGGGDGGEQWTKRPNAKRR